MPQSRRMARMMNAIAFLVACTPVSMSMAKKPVEMAARAEHPGDALRSRLGIALPPSDTMIIVYGVAQHHTRTEWSVVASRSKDGSWTIQRAGEEGPGLLQIEPHSLPNSSSTLSGADAGKLDRLLKGQGIFREKPTGGELIIGGYVSAMEIITPKRSRTVEWAGRLTGKLGEVADLVIGTG